MSRYFYIFCIACLTLAVTPSAAQNTPIGKRIPDVRPDAWLNDVRPHRDSEITCIEFFHPASVRSRRNIEHLDSLAAHFPRKDFQFVVIAAGEAEAVVKALTPLTAEGVAVGLDTDNDCFKAFGVSYLPACVIIDNQRKAVWTGDSRSLTAKLIEDLKQQ